MERKHTFTLNRPIVMETMEKYSDYKDPLDYAVVVLTLTSKENPPLADLVNWSMKLHG